MPNPNGPAVAQVAYDAGFRGDQLINAVAYALAESEGNPNALNDNPKTGDYSVGYWQINYFGDLLAGRTKQFGPPASLRGVNPTGNEARANAKAAYALSGGGVTWKPWQADINNGRYYSHLNDAKAAVAQFMGGAVAPGAVGSPGSNTTANPANPGVSAPPVDNSEQDHCLLKVPVPFASDFCLLSTNQARALGGGVLMAGGALLAVVGVALFVGKETGVINAAKNIPGPWGAAATVVSGSNKDADDKYFESADVPTGEARTAQRQRANKAMRGESRSLEDDDL